MSEQPRQDIPPVQSPPSTIPPAAVPRPPVAPVAPDMGDDLGMRMLLPVGRSPYAIAAGYLGLLGIGVWPLAPFAVVFGILGIRDIRRNPHKHGMGRCIFGIVAGVIFTLVLIPMIYVAVTH